MNVCSPKDGFILKVLVEDGKAVQAGAVLLQLDSERESRAAEQIRVRESMRQLDEAQFTGEQLALLRSVAKAAVDSAAAQYTDTKKQYDFHSQQVQLGVALPIDSSVSVTIEAKFAQATFDLNRARADQKQLEYSIDRHLKGNELSKGMNEYYVAQIKTRIDRLTIRAPIAGLLKLHVQEGSFAKLGSTILEIT